MNIYYVVRPDKHGYDQYDAFVVVAASPAAACKLICDEQFAPYPSGYDPADYQQEREVWSRARAVYLGQAGVEQAHPRIVLGSFNAG